jgi:holo-[acyl-carrier protein] synthase
LIFGVGIDIIEVSRIEKQLSRGDDRFQRRLFTDREIAYCERKKFKGLHFAARFAAKEAFLKALGTGLSGGLSWKDVEVVNNEAGMPTLRLNGKARLLADELGLTGLHVSLTHVKDTAAAVVIIEK